jgi:hypothetical protein
MIHERQSKEAFDGVARASETLQPRIGGPLVNDASRPAAIRFDGWFPNPIITQFDRPNSSSDASAILLRAAAEELGLTAALAHLLHNQPRDVVATPSSVLAEHPSLSYR